MKESKLYQIFRTKITKADPTCFCYKIPDTFNLGGKKPFDMFLLVKGVAFAIEFKSKNGLLSKYQAYQLTEFINAGGNSLIFKEGNNMDIFIENIIKAANGEPIENYKQY